MLPGNKTSRTPTLNAFLVVSFVLETVAKPSPKMKIHQQDNSTSDENLSSITTQAVSLFANLAEVPPSAMAIEGQLLRAS